LVPFGFPPRAPCFDAEPVGFQPAFLVGQRPQFHEKRRRCVVVVERRHGPCRALPLLLDGGELTINGGHICLSGG